MDQGERTVQGSLKVVKNSKGEKVWRLQWRENGKGRTRILGTYAKLSRAHAEEQRRAIIEPLPSGRTSGRTAGLTLSGYIETEYLPSCSSHWKRSTELTTTSLIESYILPQLGDRLIAQVSRRDLQQHLDSLAAAEYSRSIVDHVRFQLRAIFRLAAGDRRVVGNPTEGLKSPRMAPAKQPPIGDTALIGKALMMLPTRERLFLALATWRGLRPGEIVGLQIGDIGEGFIRISRRVYRGHVDTPKSDLGTRDIPIGNLSQLIAEHVATLERTGPGDWLFPSEKLDTPVNAPAFYRKRLQPTLTAAGLAGLTFQAMRRTFATAFAEKEPDPKVRAVVMGHTTDVHESVYRQVTKEQKVRSILRFEEPVQ